MRKLFLSLLFVAIAFPAFALNPDEVLKDPVLENRARELSKEIRCVVCQNQSIDDSDAELARDLRIVVRERLVEGDSDDQVIEFLVTRYGDFVLLRPPFQASTYFLWLSPVFILFLGIFAIITFFKRKADSINSLADPLSAEEEKRLKALLGSEESK
ncbi:MAG: cytochrome c-type biogenesis protein CcmH [Rhodospirillales bacterium]|nr:cytochrome c-type biogenesis protein CcmH [Rhodospirillales bacterium]